MSSEFRPLVTIVIPVFNGSSYLGEAIDSALAQTYANIEVVVVNDGSADEGRTEDIALRYGDRIRYFSKPNGGTSTALNVGIRNMRGDYFCWLSHDDLYHPECVEAQIKALSGLEDKTTITMTDLCTMDEGYNILCKDTQYSLSIEEWPPRRHARLYPVIYMKLHGCQLMFHRSVFDRVGLFDEDMLVAQDFEFFGRAFREYPHILIPRVLGTARDSSNRQGRRSATKGSVEYSRVFLDIINAFTDDEIGQLAPTKLAFLKDMQSLYRHVGYQPAYAEISRRLFPHVHVNYTDLPGRGFNGYDLHLTMRETGYDAHQIVWEKVSDTPSVVGLSRIGRNTEIYGQIEDIESEFSVRAMFSPFFYDVLHHPLFIEAQLLHLHIIHHPAFNINLLPLISAIKPMVWTIHDPWVVSGHCVHHGTCDKWESHCADCPNLDAPFSIRHDNTAIQFELKKRVIADSNIHFIVASRWMESILRRSPIFNGKRISRVPFGVDQGIFSPGDKGLAREKLGLSGYGITLLARADRAFKGTGILAETVRRIAQHHRVTLVVVGETGLLENLRGTVELVEKGWVDDPKTLANLYRAADLVLMPSELESFGMMAAEAMSCGRVVVALDVPSSALSDTIDSPRCGLAASRSEYADAVLQLLRSPDELQVRELRSLEFARAEYSYQTYTKRLIEVYHQTISEFPVSANSQSLVEQLERRAASYRNGALMATGADMSATFRSQFVRSMLRRSRADRALAFYRKRGMKATAKKAIAVVHEWAFASRSKQRIR